LEADLRKKRIAMTTSLGTRIAVLLFVLMTFFSARAQAYTGSTFRLRIQDPTTGLGRVITDNVSLGIGNTSGDGNSAAGTIHFTGYVGNFNVTINATSAVGSDGGGVLTLSGRVAYNSIGPDTIVISLEDTWYAAPAPTVTFNGIAGGYNSTTNTVTPAGDLPTSATSIDLQSWLDVAGDVPAYGNNSGATILNPATLTIPSTPYTNDQVFASPTFSGTTALQPVDLSNVGANGYSIYSQATVAFTGAGGVADFTLIGQDPPDNRLPEPTSLMLLGSALLGLGLLRMKKQI
jgi:hypothetical protein